MPVIGGEQVLAAADESCSVLRDATTRDWTMPVPDLEMTVADVVAHAAERCLWYAIDLAAGGGDLLGIDLRVSPRTPPDELIDTLLASAAVVARVVDGAGHDDRGFHPFGMADASGFAAMACDELLVHTDDAARALGLTFAPTTALAAAVLHRLFPWAPTDGDPWTVLRWANGRTALPGRPRLRDWRWHCAPLATWDGRLPIG